VKNPNSVVMGRTPVGFDVEEEKQAPLRRQPIGAACGANLLQIDLGQEVHSPPLVRRPGDPWRKNRRPSDPGKPTIAGAQPKARPASALDLGDRGGDPRLRPPHPGALV
jgi:hypothetical protein